MALPAAFDPIVNAPRSQKIALGVMLLVLFLGAAYFLLLAPLAMTVQALRAQRDTTQVELVQSRAIVAQLATYRREVAELEQRLLTLKDRLPNEKETPPLYRALSEAALQSGLVVALFQPRPPKEQDYYDEIPIALTAEGGYHQIGQFFERMAGLPRVVNLTELHLTGLTGKGTPAPRAIRMDAMLATYMYRPPSAPAPAKPGAAAKPAARPSGATK
jgi:type IV pilus assembly protein PilO